MAEVMYFGKHKGKSVEDVPLDYLIWCATDLRRCPMPIMAELDRRAALAALPPKLRSVRLYKKRKRGRSHISPKTKVGERFEADRAAWLAAGGDPDSCPFDHPLTGYVAR